MVIDKEQNGSKGTEGLWYGEANGAVHKVRALNRC